MTAPATTPADVLVIFGITGDLARKMTFRSLYRLERRGLLKCPIVGVARREWSSDALHEHARSAIEAAGETLDEDVFARFAKRLSMVSGGFDDAKTYERLGRAIEGKHTPVFYLEVPPSLFGPIVENLAHANLTSRAGSWWRSRSATTWRPLGHSTTLAACWRSGRSFASTTSSARNRRWTSCSCGSPTRFSSRSGTATGSSACRSPWPRTSGSKDRGSFYDPSVPCATWFRTIYCS